MGHVDQGEEQQREAEPAAPVPAISPVTSASRLKSAPHHSRPVATSSSLIISPEAAEARTSEAHKGQCSLR